MHLAVEGDKLVVVIEDQGAGIADVDWAKQPSNTTAPEEHLGLGLYFISEFMDEFEIETQVGHGTRCPHGEKALAGQAARGRVVAPCLSRCERHSRSQGAAFCHTAHTGVGKGAPWKRCPISPYPRHPAWASKR